MTRLKTFASHVRSRRAILLAAASTAAVFAIALDGTISVILGLVALAGYSALILILSIRVSQTVAGIRAASRARSSSPVETIARRKPSDQDRLAAIRMTSAIDILGEVADRLSAEHSFERVRDSLARDGGPRVTVVVPCYNEQRFVAEALRSVAEQTFVDWECLVVDDASTDRSLRAIWAVTALDPRFRVLRHQTNSGLSAARNTGLRAARGRFVTFLDADDLLMRDSLMDRVVALSNAASDPHIIGSYCGVRVAFEEVTLDDLPNRMDADSTQIIDFVSADSECPFNAHAPLLVTERLRSLGGFNERMRFGAEDWNLWYRAMRNGYVFVPSRHKTAVYRQKRHSMVRSMPDGHVQEANRLIEAAHQRADPDLLVSPTPTPLTQPIGHYQALIHRADRAIRFAAMALVAGDEPAAVRALGVFQQAPLSMLERHLDLSNLTDRGMQRALAVSTQELSAVNSLWDPIKQRMRTLVLEVSSKYAAEPIPPASRLSTGVLLVPHHAGLFPVMVQAATDAGFSSEEIGVLRIEREGGTQGAAAEVPETIPNWSLNEWVLQGGACSAVVVGRVRIGVVDQLVMAVTKAGGIVIEVDQDNAEIMYLAEAHRSELTPVAGPVWSTVAPSFVGVGTGASSHIDDEPTSWWQVEEYPDTMFDSEALAAFKDRHRGERVVIVGNGPSLNELDLTRLKSEHTIAVNGIFYARDQMGFDPSYYVVEDTAVMRDNLDEIIAYDAGHKFFPSMYRQVVGEHQNVTYFMMNRGFYDPASPDFCVPRFSVDPTQRVYSGQSVTLINLQLAYHMGFEEVVLIGMDFSYTVPPDAIVEGDIITSTSGDPNHFHPEYFGPGKVWKDPKLDRVLANYAMAKQIYEADGRRIVNATAGGRLELFERVDYTSLF